MTIAMAKQEKREHGVEPVLSEDPVHEVSILDILLVLTQHKRLIAASTVLTTIIGLTTAVLVKPVFTAKTVILPPQQSGSAASGMMAELSSLGALGGLASGGLGLKNPADMYVAMFKSETVENDLIRSLGLDREYRKAYLSLTRRALESHVKVTADTKTSLISIAAEDFDPVRAAAIANGYVNAYRHFSEHLAISEAAQRRLFFQQQLDESKNNLAHAEAALVKTQQKTGLLSLDSQSRALIESAASLRAQVTAKEVQIQGMQSYAAADNASLVQAQRELTELREQLSRLGGNGDLNSAPLLVPQGKVPAAGLEYVRALREVKYNETIFNILARQFEVAKLDEAREGALIQVVDPATVPDRKSSPKRALWTLSACAAGFLLSVFYVLGRAAMRVLRRDSETNEKLNALRASLVRRKYRVQQS